MILLLACLDALIELGYTRAIVGYIAFRSNDVHELSIRMSIHLVTTIHIGHTKLIAIGHQYFAQRLTVSLYNTLYFFSRKVCKQGENEGK